MTKYLRQIDDFLTEEECYALKKMGHKKGFDKVDRDIAQYGRVTFNDKELSNELYERLKEMVDVPEYFDEKRVIGLNETFRMSMYEPGEKFGIHKDSFNQDSDGNRSVMTLNIFLNDRFEGGETDFYNEDKSFRYSVKPKVG